MSYKLVVKRLSVLPEYIAIVWKQLEWIVMIVQTSKRRLGRS